MRKQIFIDLSSKFRIFIYLTISSRFANCLKYRGKVTNREVYEVLLKKEIKKKKKPNLILYSNIQLNMNNLAKKKILKINRIYKTHGYAAEINRKELAKSIIKVVAEKLL